MTLREMNTGPGGRVGFFAPRTWAFWRALATCFCACCLLGHWLEFPYCWMTDSLFGIVEDDYALYTDPWFHPYWVYGFGALGMTFALEPVKGRLVRRCGRMWRAVLASFLAAVVLAMLMEWGMGALVNQPDGAGNYPYWDNSELPFNVGGQAWLFNDVFIALAAMVYMWLIFPLVCRGYAWLERGRGRAPSPRRANAVFACLVAAFAAACARSYALLAGM